MFPAPSMTLLARNAQFKSALLVIMVIEGVGGVGVGGMALKTARQDGAIKIRHSIKVSWTVDPGFQLRPVRDWKLKELISLPIKIALALSVRTDHHIEALAVACGLGSTALDRGLKKSGI